MGNTCRLQVYDISWRLFIFAQNGSSMETIDIIKGIKDIAIRNLPTGSDAVLFGSRARGDARDDSDWDILILIDTERVSNSDFDRYAYPFVDYGWSVGAQINPIMYSFSDWHKRNFTPFYKSIQSEGISLCR